MLLPLSGTEEGRRSIYIRFSGAKEAGEISLTMAGEVVTYIGLQLPDSSPAPKRAGEVFIYTVGEVFIYTAGEVFIHFSAAGDVFMYTAGEVFIHTAGEVFIHFSAAGEVFMHTAGEVFIHTAGEVFIHFSGFSGAGEAGEVFIYTVKNTTKFTGKPEIFDPQKSFPGCVLLRYLRMNVDM